MQRSDKGAAFTNAMWEWYTRHKRTLPWRDLKVRDDTQRAYMVLVSEVMLQQTQVPRVEVIFRRFLRVFPTLKDLARASNNNVILAWRGMGYNSRALRLRDAARCIVERFQVHRFQVAGNASSKIKHETCKPATCNFPRSMEQLREIPGIGPYTAAAILNFAFNIPTPCIDTNIRRIIHRVFVGPEKRDGTWKKDDKALLPIVADVLSGAMDHQKDHDAKNWSAALMDFGSLVCTKRSPKCELCPLAKRKVCRSAGTVMTPLKADSCKLKARPEPGRMIAGKFTPNRIIRGRVVEFLRDQPRGASLHDIGAHACIDWDRKEHAGWLRQILTKLEGEGIVRSTHGKYGLAA